MGAVVGAGLVAATAEVATFAFLVLADLVVLAPFTFAVVFLATAVLTFVVLVAFATAISAVTVLALFGLVVVLHFQMPSTGSSVQAIPSDAVP